MTDDEVPGFLESLGAPGIVDAHVHFLPDRVQEAVWRWFDGRSPAWPITYRLPAPVRLATLARLGVRHHTALAYAHRPGMLRFLNDHTLGLAAAEPAVIPTFTIYPEQGAGAETDRCLQAGGRCVKVHLQVGKFELSDPRLTDAWALLERAGTPVILHLAAVGDGSGGEEYCGASHLWRLLEHHPYLRPVVAHLGAPDATGELFARAAELPELRFDTAMAVFPTAQIWTPPDWLPDRLAEFGDRILFGSDFPTIPRVVADQVSALANFDLGEDWLRGVLWE
ncbi:MAG: amidohydrolase family protein, partial [Acidimicrobiales bacterium]